MVPRPGRQRGRSLRLARSRLRPVQFGHHAQNDRWIIQAVFPKLRGGFFVEAGATNGGRGSASNVLEREYAWHGICVEPVDRYFTALENGRRSCAKDNRCLADRTGDLVEFLSYPDDFARSGIKAAKKNGPWAERNHAHGVTSMKQTVTLADLLDQHDAPNIVHYLCLDVEGAEPLILEAFNFDGDYRILAISVEGPRCDALLRSHGYVQAHNQFAPKAQDFDHYFVHETVQEQCPALVLV
jgi:FkbM family methyltransferase